MGWLGSWHIYDLFAGHGHHSNIACILSRSTGRICYMKDTCSSPPPAPGNWPDAQTGRPHTRSPGTNCKWRSCPHAPIPPSYTPSMQRLRGDTCMHASVGTSYCDTQRLHRNHTRLPLAPGLWHRPQNASLHSRLPLTYTLFSHTGHNKAGAGWTHRNSKMLCFSVFFYTDHIPSSGCKVSGSVLVHIGHCW